MGFLAQHDLDPRFHTNIGCQIPMSSPESPSRFIYESRSVTPTLGSGNRRPSAGAFGINMSDRPIFHPPAFGSPWQPAVLHNYRHPLDGFPEPRVVELGQGQPGRITELPAISLFDNSLWAAGLESRDDCVSPRSQVPSGVPGRRPLANQEPIPSETQRETPASGGFALSQAEMVQMVLPPLRPRPRTGTAVTVISISEDGLSTKSSTDWTLVSTPSLPALTHSTITIKTIQDICLEATQKYLQAHQPNRHPRACERHHVPATRSQGRQDRRFYPYPTTQRRFPPAPPPPGRASDRPDDHGTSRAARPTAGQQRASRGVRPPACPTSRTSFADEPFAGTGTRRYLRHGDDYEHDGNGNGDADHHSCPWNCHCHCCHDSDHPPPTPDSDSDSDSDSASLLANAGAISALLWQQAHGQRPGATTDTAYAEAAVVHMSDLLQWAVCVSGAVAGTAAAAAAVVVIPDRFFESARRLCDFLGDREAVAAVVGLERGVAAGVGGGGGVKGGVDEDGDEGGGSWAV
ncbi:hypothetical protein QBC33DRAFT_330896 [Phialemonium atrogriseum]|uniref:Uncharacterized protein n=1 Tax=Phialemonium atrogriseum TaxID=1093897 RepID=A0AAJ0FIJ6_9PEZI|nr:uncharacterized protein QBC33DRAFT_330896 [Phialemonium atrogriseum]KAK1769676.1 hypothetical protein QBC33DRAFT_330896 [Phialemonium atrogriseum]